MTTAGVQRPGLMPSIVNSIGSSARRALGFGDVGVDATHERFDDGLAARVIVIQFGVEIAAEHVQPRADVAIDLTRPENLGDRSRRLPPPHLELEQPISGRGIALREEQVVLGLGVDVVDAPAVAHDFDRLRNTRRPAASRRRWRP